MKMSDQGLAAKNSQSSGVVLSAIIINPEAKQVSRSELPN